MIKAIFYFWGWDYLVSVKLINWKLHLLSVFQSVLLETQQHWQLVISHGQKSGHQASNMHTTLNWTISSSYCFSSRTQIVVLSQHRSYRCGRYNGSITTAAASTDSLSLTKIHLILTYKMLHVLKLLRHFVMLKFFRVSPQIISVDTLPTVFTQETRCLRAVETTLPKVQT